LSEHLLNVPDRMQAGRPAPVRRRNSDDFENGEVAQKYTNCFAEAQHLQEKGVHAFNQMYRELMPA
jgi:hypothetical protein